MRSKVCARWSGTLRVLLPWFTVAACGALAGSACGGRTDEAGDAEPLAPSNAVPAPSYGATPSVPAPADSLGAMEPGAGSPDVATATRSVIEAQLGSQCGTCHGQRAVASGNVQGGVSCVEDLDCLVESELLVVMDSERSRLIQVMLDGSMPPPGIDPRPTAEDIQRLIEFVEQPAFWHGL